MAGDTLRVALVSEVFATDDAACRLVDRLREVRAMDAELAVLPELPLQAWVPAHSEARDDDAEPPGGPRHQVLATACRAAGLGAVGGAIVRDPSSGRRTNRALVFDASGTLVLAYDKLHLPDEPGFREPAHYEPGSSCPSVTSAFGMPIGVQLCSDVNRPEGSHVLGALGAEAIFAPRASELRTYQRWRPVFQAVAITSATYLVSVNRPAPEDGVGLGGPSIAVDPSGQILLETTSPLSFVTLDRSVVRQARTDYPGCLPIRADLYAEGWRSVVEAQEMKSEHGGRGRIVESPSARMS